jgi:hypothetical protein
MYPLRTTGIRSAAILVVDGRRFREATTAAG